MKKLFSNFLICGITGWCLEIIFTAFHSFKRRQMQLQGNTSIWMFFIYGMASFLLPLFRLLKGCSLWIRGSVYAVCIFIGEFLTGSFLAKRRLCPWDYSRSKWHLKRVIRLDYFFNWFFAGLLFEKLMLRRK